MTRFSILLLVLMLGLSTVSFAQTPAAPGTQASVRVSLKDGAFRRRGVMMRIQNGKISRLTAPFTLANGTVVNPDGELVTAAGARQQLLDGRAVNLQGEVVGLSDDMLTAATIQQLDQMVTGYTGTVVPVSNAIPVEAATALQRLERKAALLEQLTERLAQRTAQAVPASAEATQLDAQLSAVDAKLKP